MNLRGIGRLFAAAFALVALFSGNAAAQYTPTLTGSATGNSVTIEWTAIAGAQGYTLVAGTTPGGSQMGTYSFPAALGTKLVVTAPTGNYFLRVRAFAGTLNGPFSNEVTVSPGVEPCVPGTTSTVTTSVNNSEVTVNWAPVPGATSYIVQWSRTSGITELAETFTTTSTKKSVPWNGTFYVRVVAVSACGNTTSAEKAFTIAVTKRYLSSGEIQSIMQQTAAAYPQAWFNAHRDGTPERWDFIILATRRLYQASGGTVGANYRRGVVGDLSMDGLSVENPADGRYYFVDAISGAGGPNPQIAVSVIFSDSLLLRNDSGRYAPEGFANPLNHKTYVNYGSAGGW